MVAAAVPVCEICDGRGEVRVYEGTCSKCSPRCDFIGYAPCSCQEKKPKTPRHRPRDPVILALQSENAELRGFVVALWQRLGDVIKMHHAKEHRSEKDQITLSHAKQLHTEIGNKEICSIDATIAAWE